MCSGEPRAMLKKARGKVDPPIYTIQICIPKHGLYPVFIDSPVDCCCVICGILRVDIYIYRFVIVSAMNLIFSFTNGRDWDGPYRLQFQIPKALQNKPVSFFNEVREKTMKLVRSV